jgi:secreted trypsin-like serine protease
MQKRMLYKSNIFATLQGDSGGPLVHFQPQPIQIGILLFGHKLCGYNVSYPSVYISIGHFRDWIDNILATSQRDIN